MSLEAKLKDDLKSSMKAGDKAAVSTLRFLMAELKNAAIEKKAELTDEDVMEIIARQVKRRVEAVDQFRAGGREDLVEKETWEADFLRSYLPPRLTEDELLSLIKETIGDMAASGLSDMGKVMSAVMPKVKGRADGKEVSRIVRECLA